MQKTTHVPDALPSSRTLARSAVLAIAVAGVLLVSVVLPAEYGIDPLGTGRMLGLTEMGTIKMALIAEEKETAAVEAALVAGQPDPRLAATAAPKWRDSMTVTLAPNAGVELKLEMRKNQKALYEWRADSADLNFNLHGEPPNPPKGFSHSYGRGASLVGSGVTSVALAAFAYQLSGRNATPIVGTALALRILSFVTVSPTAGVLADRVDRKRMLIAADVVCVGLLSVFSFITTVWRIYVLIFAVNGVTAFFTPTFEASIPDVVGERR